MEQFVLGIFQEHLSKFIVGFHKEQVNANLLNGKGEIKDVSLNCDFLNELLKKVTPIELLSVHASKLSFHVTAWSNLKKAPIVVDIEDVTAVIVEPLEFLDRSQRKVPKQISQQELNDLIAAGLQKLRGAYNLFDRIVDNIHVEMRSLHVSFQPRGKFKTTRVGPWTPPTLQVELRHIKYVCVDEYGQEGTPEQVWNHNRHQPGVAAPHRTIMIYKKLSLQATMGLKDAVSGEELPSLIRDAQVEVHVAFRKRLRDAAVLAIQVDVTARKVEVHVPTEAVPMLAHAMAGIQYCLAKDRAFQDPLAKKEGGNGGGEAAVEEAVVVTTDEEEQTDEDDGEDDEEMIVDVSDSGSESEEEDQEGQSSAPPVPPAKQSSSVSSRSQSAYQRRPVILLPNGLVIHERLSFSLSVHQCTVRGIYIEEVDGYIQLVTKGLVAEAMWPKDSGEKGGYVQASLSFISLQERYGQRIRSILLGGVQHNINKLPIGLPGTPRPEKGADSSFPLFEDRSIRPDPFGLRHTFPEQAFGLKTTIEFIERVSNPDEEDVMVLHEIGIDRFDVLMDSDAWCRALRFAMNEAGGGFDPRWHSGDWSDELTTDMLVNPSQSLNLADFLQPKKEILLDENLMISSDLMNATARIMNVEVRVPAAIQKDVRSCDICLTIAETMLVVSSALPRTFLTGKIGASIHGEGSESDGRIEFPNDPSDLCYALEATEDPSMRQRGEMTGRNISTARCQLTIRGLSMRVVPVIPFCNATQPQQLMEPTEMTMIVCFEGEPPTSPESNLVKIVLFMSLQFHRLALNCDLDVIAGALSTIIYHNDVMQEAIGAIQTLQTSLQTRSNTIEQEGGTKTRKSLKSRRVLVRKQIERSREAGGLSVSACMQLAEFSFTVWRQNVPLTSRFRASLSNDVNVLIDDTPIALVKLMLFEMKGLEVGAEWSVQQMSSRRIVLKGCLSELKMGICDFEAECARCMSTSIDQGSGGNGSSVEDSKTELVDEEHHLIELFTFGLHAHEHRSYAEVAWGHNDILLRAEEYLNSTRSMSLACEVGPPGVAYLRVREIESLCLLLIEALLMPTGLQADRFKTNGHHTRGIQFPDRSVGALFSWFIRSCSGSSDVGSEATATTNKEKIDEVDGLVRASVRDMLPDRVNNIMAQILVVDVLVFVPDKAVSLETENKTRWLGLVVHQTRLLSGYFSSEGWSSDQHGVMNKLASAGTTWENLFASQEQGIHLTVRARPSLYNGVRKDSMCITTECLVSEFEITCSYNPSDFAISMGDTTLGVKNLDDMHHLHTSLLAVKEQGSVSLRTIGAVLSALRREKIVERRIPREEPGDGSDSDETASHVVVVETSSEQSLQGLRRSLTKLREVSEAHALELKDVLEQQQQKICVLRYEVFERERDRIAALALMSSQMTGWLKMGGTHVYGQRLTGVTTMWRYYVVLHKSLLILYSSPGQPKPMDIVFLEDAHLLPLAGGRRKRDAKRGFSIVESGGVARFFMAESGPEFELWIRSIDRITKSSRDGESFELEEEKSQHGSSHSGTERGLLQSRDLTGSSSRDFHADDTDPENTPRRAQIRQRFSAVTSSTKSKLGSAAAGAKTKLGPAASSTKSRIGSVVQAARHRSTSDAEDEFEREVATESHTASAHQADSFSSGRSLNTADVDTGENQPSARSGRFAAVRAGTKNRFGSALQVAKEKGKAAAEQRRRRLHDREDHSHVALPDPFTAGIEAQSIMSSNPTQLRSTATPLDKPTVATIPPIAEHHPAVPENAAIEEGNMDHDDILAERGGMVVESSIFEESGEYRSETSLESAGSRRGQQLKSKLGAAVQSVRRGTTQDGTLRRRFGNSSREGNDLLDDSTAIKLRGIKLRGIHVGLGSPVEGLYGDLTENDIKLNAINGYWVTHVEPYSIESDIAVPVGVESADNGAETAEFSELAERASHESSGETKSSVEEGTEGDDSPMTTPGRQISLEHGFRIRVVRGTGRDEESASSDRGVASEVIRSISDLVALQTALSECVCRVMHVASAENFRPEGDIGVGTKRYSIPKQDMTALDSVRFAGRLLKGLVETGSDEFENVQAFNDYQCEILKEFLNLTLDTPLPQDGIEATSHFLKCPDMVTGASSHQPRIDSSAILDVVGPEIGPPITSSRSILACAVACENDLARLETLGRSERQPVIMERKDDTTSCSKEIIDLAPAPMISTPLPFLEPLLPFTVTESLKGAMHHALMKIMTERDEAHAQLIAASVLHVHEIEQERKRVDRLNEQLKVAHALVKAAELQNVAGNFFADKSIAINVEKTRESMKGKMNAMQEQTLQNAEQDMLNLCQQLAREISAKTSASLEIIRLKESRKIEQENEQAEKTALQEELRRCKEQLASQEREAEEARQEADAWKDAYEKSKETKHGESREPH